MPEFQRTSFEFVHQGLCLSRPVDALPKGKYAIAKNIRTYQQGVIRARSGLTLLSGAFTGGNYIHSIRRMNDPNPGGEWARVVGVDTALYMGQSDAGGDVPFQQVETGFSGKPLSLVIFRPEDSPHPWCYVGDSVKMRKYSPTKKTGPVPTSHPVGLPVPNDVPSVAATGAGSGNLQGDYFYRFRVRDVDTGARSNPGPANRTAITINEPGDSVTITLPNIPGVVIDVFRYGGVVKSWRWVASGEALDTIIDNKPDGEALGSESLTFDNWQPFPTLGRAAAGTVNVNTHDVQWTSGQPFNVNWPAGTEIVIDGTVFTLYRQPTSEFTLEIVEDGGSKGGVTYLVSAPIVLGQPLPRLWGPYGLGEQGAVMFGCGAPSDAGSLFWTNGNDPDTTDPANNLEITSPGEPLQNGCIYDGRPYIWSTDRMFVAYPRTGETSLQFAAQVIPGGKGLFGAWAFAVGPKIWFVSKDGIYETTGGEPVSITDADLYPFFPHDNQPPKEVNGIKPPDFTQTDKLRLTYHDGYLYFDYCESGSGHPRTLVYDTVGRFWVSLDDHGFAAPTGRAFEEGEAHSMLVGFADKLYYAAGLKDAGFAIHCHVRTGCFDAGDTRARKLFGEVEFDSNPMGSTVTVKVLGDDATKELASVNVAAATRTRTIIDLNSGLGELNRNLALDVNWVTEAGEPELYEWQPSFVAAKPEDTARRATDWDDDGNPGAKFLRGLIIRGDTAGAEKTVQVQGDGGTVIAELAVQITGDNEQVCAFNPKVTHLMRLVPKDPTSWRLFSATWIWDRYPEFSTIQDDYGDLGKAGAKHVRGVLIQADTAGQPVVIHALTDGGNLAKTFTVNQSGRTAQPYAFTPPFLAHTLQLLPLGNWRKFHLEWIYDQYPEFSRLYTPWMDGGEPGAKYVRGVRLHADTLNQAVQIQVEKDGGVLAVAFNAQHAGPGKVPYAFAAPFLAYLLRLIPQADWRLFEVEWIYDKYPDYAALIQPWSDAGHPGAKFVQGMRLRADSAGTNVSLQVQGDGGSPQATVSVNHPTDMIQPYSWTPFVAHMLRIVPAAPISIFGEDWIWEPLPELATLWQTQGTSHGLKGYQHLRDGFIALMSSAPVILTVKAGQVPYQYTIPSTGGLYDRPRVVFRPMKAKVWEYTLSSSLPFRLFKKDCEINARAWGDPGPYVTVNPFGDAHTDAARI